MWIKITPKIENQFKKLYLNGESMIIIGKKFNVVDATVFNHLRKSGIKIRNKKEAAKIAIKKGRMKPPKPIQNKIPKSSKKLTKEKAYILGVLCGDGYINLKNYEIALQSIDKEFTNKFSKYIYNIYKINPKKSLFKVKNPKWRDKYCSRTCSKELIKDLQIYHKNFKTFEWEVPYQILNSSREKQIKFLQGFFDSEGYVNINGKMIVGASASLKGLKQIKRLLNKLKIRSIIYNIKNRNVKLINIQDKISIENFKNLINFVINRKKENLKKLVNNYKRYKPILFRG